MNLILSLFKHRHKWEATHVNKFQHVNYVMRLGKRLMNKMEAA